MDKRLLLASPHMSDEGYELEYIHDAFQKNWIAPLGENVNEFEKSMGAYMGKGYPVALSAGTAALHLAMILAGVKAGDTVERGELLFETVTGTLDGLYAPDRQVVSDAAGVIATVDAGNGTSVEKDAKIATIYPNDAMQIKMVISEADLMDVTVGGKAEIEFNWDADSGRRFEGTISSISYLSEKQSDSAASQSAQYVAYVDFTPDETVRIGMTVIVYVE